MNKLFKKSLAVIISVIMVFSALPFWGIDFSDFSVWAAEYITGDVFTLGSYPQSKVTDKDLLAELDNYSISWEDADSFSGNGSIGSMSNDGSVKYFDVDHNGTKYRAVTFSDYRPELTYRQSTDKNSYQDDNGYNTNTVYWFKYEPLKWRVISNEGVAVCETLVDAQAYANKVYKIANGTAVSEDDYYSNQSATVYANSYADSTVGYWLNGGFIDTAFTDAEKEQLVYSKLGENDYDKVFLPSYDEVSAMTDSQMVASGTDYAKAMGLCTVEGNSFWWLRDAGAYSYYALRVNNEGVADTNGNSVDFACFGVRPAIRVGNGIGGAYKATFDYENGNTETVWFVAGESVSVPEAPEKEGYEFVGWVDSVTGEAMPETMPAGNVTYVPDWKGADGVAYTVYTYLMSDDGSVYDDTSAVRYGITGETVTIEATDIEGFTFVPDISVVSGEILADGSTEFHLFYSRNQYTVTINGVSGEYYFGSEITLESPEAPEGYSFSHWENQNGDTVVSPFTVSAEEIILTPVFSVLTFEVTFVSDGEIHYTDNLEFGAEILAPDSPSKEGHEFIGWSLDGVNVTENLGTVPAGGVIFTAVYSVNSYTVNYYVQKLYSEESILVDSLDAEYGSIIYAQLDGYDAPFGYSVSDEAYTDSGFVNALEYGATVPAGGIDLYFKLVPNVYDAEFDANGGMFSDGSDIMIVPTAYESEIVVPEVPVMDGYEFDGWDPAVSTMDEEGKYFVATWTPAVYTVTYYQHDEVYEEFEMYYGDEFDVPADPYISGYEFLGWAEEADSDELAELPEYMPAYDLVYYAVFEKTGYSTYWVVDGKTEELVFDYGQEVEAPEEPVKSGYTFAGWDPMVPATMPEEEITFTAKWTDNNDNNLTFKTELLKQNPDTGKWEVTDFVNPGDEVKARLYIDTSYYTHAGTFMVFYDNDFFEDDYDSLTRIDMKTNSEALGNKKISVDGLAVKHPSTNNSLVDMVKKGYITQAFVDTHQVLVCQYTISPSNSFIFNGDYWFAEFDLKVKDDASGSGEFIVEEGTVQSTSRTKAYTNIPLNKENGNTANSTALYNLDVNIVTMKRPVYLENTQSVSTNGVSVHFANFETQAVAKKLPLSSAKTELEYDWVYFENKTYTPTVYLTYDNEPFDANKELAITYKNNSKPGKATVELVGENRFTGLSSLDFIISNEQIPEKVKNFTVIGGLNKIELSWTSSASKFNIYRKIEGGKYTLLATVTSKSYTDTIVQIGVNYYYQVAGVGVFDVEGEKSVEAVAVAYADTQAPEGVTMNSASGSTLSGTATFTASATDNDRPAKAVYSYSTDGGATWIPMGEATDSNFTATLDTTAINATKIKVKVVFEDAAGNKSNPFIAEYTISNAPAFTMEIRVPSRTEIKYGDAIYLHADVTGTLPAGAKIKWIASNNNFTMEVSEDTFSCKISPNAKGVTTFSAVVVDANDNPISPVDTQDMNSNAGIFQKIIAFFKKLFGLTKVYPQNLF